jgi:hypothetical protein
MLHLGVRSRLGSDWVDLSRIYRRSITANRLLVLLCKLLWGLRKVLKQRIIIFINDLVGMFLDLAQSIGYTCRTIRRVINWSFYHGRKLQFRIIWIVSFITYFLFWIITILFIQIFIIKIQTLQNTISLRNWWRNDRIYLIIIFAFDNQWIIQSFILIRIE